MPTPTDRPAARHPLVRPLVRPAVRPAARRRAAALLLGGLLAPAVLPVVGAGPAAAHDRLESTDPADGAGVAVAPDAVVLTMSSPPLALGTRVQVTGPAGVVSTGEARVVDDTVTQAVTGERPAGTYEVQWRVTSSDGHPVSGSFTFTAASAAAEGPTASPTTTAGGPAPSASTSTAPAADPVDPASSGGGGALVAVAAAVVVVVGGAGGIIGYRRRRG